ncbi:hypothetical protein PTKIN_Ptkin14bG0078500 [Pterospermum kingtungense]
MGQLLEIPGKADKNWLGKTVQANLRKEFYLHAFLFVFEKNALVFLTIKGGDPTTFRIKSESAAGVVSEKDIESYLQKELNELKHENPTKELLNVLNGQLELKMVTETTVSDSAAVIKNEKAAS